MRGLPPHIETGFTPGPAQPASANPEATSEESMRDRILNATAQLLGEGGYSHASMRAIGQATGIQGPSVYHHFASKDAIIEELLATSLDASAALAHSLASESGDPAVRLYRMIVFDFVNLYAARYDFRGVYNPSLLVRPAFHRFREQLDRMHADVATILMDGVESGRFLDVRPALVQEAISGLVLRVFSVDAVHLSDALDLAESAAQFVLRAILIEPDDMGAVREQARLHFVEDGSVADSGTTVADGNLA